MQNARLWFIVGDPSQAVCWPYFSECFAYRPSAALLGVGVAIYTALAIGALIAFLLTARGRALAFPACAMLAGALFVKAAIIAQDFRLTGDYHYVVWWVAFAFLFLPRKLDLVRLTVCALYMAGGALKFNQAWLSGRVLFGPVPESRWLVEAGCFFAVLMEMWLVLYLLRPGSRLFWPALAMLAGFHLLSFQTVGFQFPLVMLCLLAIFPLARRESKVDLLEELVRGRSPRSTYAFLLALLIAQAIPSLLSREPAVSGEGRPFALVLFDDKVECFHSVFVEFSDRTLAISDRPMTQQVRLRCDPILFWNHGRMLCRRFADQPGFKGLRYRVTVSSVRTPEPRHLIDFENFCASAPKYHFFATNDWIRSRRW